MKDNSLKWDDSKDYQSFPHLIAKIETISYNSSIEYCEWQMVENKEKKVGQKNKSEKCDEETLPKV